MLIAQDFFHRLYPNQLFNAAALFRELSLEIEASPESIFIYDQHTEMIKISLDRNSTASERVSHFEALAYGDPGVFLASPWHSLSGLIIDEIGNPEQIENFYQFISQHQARSFFALTEPAKGSDANNIECSLVPTKDKKGYYLTGEKYLIGNGAISQIGVAIARTSENPLSIRAVLIKPEKLTSHSENVIRTKLDMSGLNGAQLAHLRFDNVYIKNEDILGNHLSPVKHGMMAIIKTFNRLRSGIGALALGQTQAVVDHCYEHQNLDRNTYHEMCIQIAAVRKQLNISARMIDQNPCDSSVVSFAKVNASKIAVEIISRCIGKLPSGTLLENQWLSKCYRDCFCWEYMEGTRHILLKNAYSDFISNLINNHDAVS